MKMAVRAMLVALATLALASPSFAATVAPTSYPFILKVDSFGSLYVIMSFITHRTGHESWRLDIVTYVIYCVCGVYALLQGRRSPP